MFRRRRLLSGMTELSKLVELFVRGRAWRNMHVSFGWSLGWISAVDSNGRTIFVTDAHSDDGKRFVVRADEKLTAFMKLESAIRACGKLV